MSVDFQTLINTPQAYSVPSKQQVQQPKSSRKVDITPKPINSKKDVLIGSGIVAAGTAGVIGAIAGKGNPIKGLSKMFKNVDVDGIKKPLEESIEQLKQKLSETSNVMQTKVDDLTQKLAAAGQKKLDEVVANPKENKGFIAKLVDAVISKPKENEDVIVESLDRMHKTKGGELTQKIENKVIDMGSDFSEIERMVKND